MTGRRQPPATRFQEFNRALVYLFTLALSELDAHEYDDLVDIAAEIVVKHKRQRFDQERPS